MARIMIMEDDSLQAGLLADELAAMGHDAIVTFTASEALARLEETKVDLLITDIFVKGSEGFIADGGILLIGRLRSAARQKPLSWLASLPILAISGINMQSAKVPTLSMAESIGATRCMAKPFSFQDLKRAVEELLGETTPET